uniref:Uncharacterized protein n=2 Tax=Arion vulgaris TaxID=1028688 RepID=A0A0B7A1Q1_9EUPU
MSEQGRVSMRRRPSKVKTPQVISHDIKCVALGDGNVGKSALMLTYLIGRYPTECPPGPMDGHSEFNHVTNKPITLNQDNVEVRMTLIDSYGQDEYDKLRERVCASADVYMLCFDVSKPVTLERISHQWLPEMRKYSTPETPFIVVGLKTDIRTKAQADGTDITNFVTYTEALKEAGELGASSYIECSAKNNTGVKRVLEKAAQAAVQQLLPADLKRSSCTIS